MKTAIRLAAAFATLAFTASAARAAIVADCGPTAGYSYYLDRGIVRDGSTGWTKDQISKGRTQVVTQGDGGYDLVFTDAMNRTISARKDGGTVITMLDAPDTLQIVVGYAGTGVTEIYSFFRERSGATGMTMQQTKIGRDYPVQKATLMVGECTALR